MKYKCRRYRNIDDFKYGTMRLEMHNNGTFIIYGTIRKKNVISKYVEGYMVDKE